MLKDFLNFISAHRLFDPNQKQLLAISGGIDSVVMGTLFHQAGIPFGVAHLNHQLRGEESEGDRLFVEDLSTEWEVPFYANNFRTRHFAGEKGISIQMAARENRMWWLEGLKEEHQYETIALGSHQDDQVETILLNLSRGSSISGLRGMLPRSGHWVKPMLFASKAQIAQFAQDNRIEYRQDSSNQTDYYERNRIRHHVIPQLKQINPSLEKTVMRNTAYLRAIELVWQEKVDEVRANVLESDNHQIRLQLSLLAQYQPVSAYLFELLHPFGFNSHQSDVLLEMMEAPPGKEMHSATHSLYTDRQHWIIVPKSEPVQSCHYSIGAGTESIEQPLSMCFRKCTIDHQPAGKATLATLDADRLQFPLALRTWRPGDRFRPLGMTGSKKLSDFFTDQKISRPNKQSTWLLCSGEDIVWVVGHRIDDRYKIGEATKNIYIAEWLKA